MSIRLVRLLCGFGTALVLSGAGCLPEDESVGGAGYASGEVRAAVVLSSGTSWAASRYLQKGVFSLATGTQLNSYADPSSDPTIRRVMEKTTPYYFRLPGGDAMNTWDWTDDAITRYYGVAQRGGSRPLWGLRILNGDPAKTQQFIQKLTSRGLPKTHFEMGNELYYTSWWADGNPNVQEYIRQARNHAAVLRQAAPGCKLGVPLASYQHLYTMSPFGPRSASSVHGWARTLAQETFYDAFVLHLYVTPNELGYLGDYTADEVARWAWIRADSAVIGRFYDLVQSLSPVRREIWVTEWAFNSTQYVNQYPNERRWQVHQTMMAALYNARFILNTAATRQDARVLTLWTLLNQFTVCLATGGNTRINYDMLRILHGAWNGCNQIARLQIPLVPTVNGPRGKPNGTQRFDLVPSPAVDAFGLFTNGVLRSVVILNFMDQAVSVQVPGLPSSLQGRTALTAQSKLPGWGNSANPLPRDWNPPYSLVSVPVSGGRVEAPKNSIAVVTVNAIP
ncbi:MAG: hypothetical protein HYY16_12430 [Planctomycetes bacterium]|nr:hypothetical protein [Planctomycetota bacterium]